MKYKSLFVALLVGCGDGGSADTDTDTDDGTTELTYFAHPCGNGDPVLFECGTDETEVPLDDATWPLCADEGIAAGDLCENDGDQCVVDQAVACDSDPTTQIRSAAYLFCQAEEFADDPCPSSSRDLKDNVHHLTTDERNRVAKQVLDLDLASYTYKEGAGAEGQQLGFIIEETEGPFLQKGGERVNLYAYISSVVATVQQQQDEIAGLRAELKALSDRECPPDP